MTGREADRVNNYRDLHIWKRSYQAALAMYRFTGTFPDHERYGLIAQIRRAAVSVPSNIAEGYSRGTRRDYLRFLWMANASIAELETQLSLARDLGYTPARDADRILRELGEIGRMIRATIRTLTNRDPSTGRPAS